MLIRLISILFLALPFLSKGQNWQVNSDVFSREYLHVFNGEKIFITSDLGFWKSDDFGKNFIYEYFKFNNGTKFFPSGFCGLSILNNNSIYRASYSSVGNSNYFLVRYNALKNQFFKVSNDSINNSIIRPFYQNRYSALAFKFDTLFKLDSVIGKYEVLNVFDPILNNIGTYSHVSEINSEEVLVSFRKKTLNSNNDWVSQIEVFKLNIVNFNLELELKIFGKSSWMYKNSVGENYLVGQYGQIFKRDSLTGNWLNIGLGKNFEVRGNFQNLDSGVCYNANYFEGRNFYYTTNGGEDWLEVELPKDLINVKGAAIKNNKVMVFGFDTVYQQTRLYQTDDITQHSIINTIKGGQPAPIGLSETKIQNTINIYPNPTNQNFTIAATEIPKAIKLFNAVGQLIYAETPMQNITQIQVSQLPRGLYFVHIQQQNGEVLLRKVVVN